MRPFRVHVGLTLAWCLLDGTAALYAANDPVWIQRGPSARTSHTMAFDSARGVGVLFGGSEGGTYKGDTWEWDGTAWKLCATTGPSPRAGHAMVYDSVRGVTVLFGGRPQLGNYSAFDPLTSGETWEWDGSVWTLRTSEGPRPRSGHSMAFDAARGVTVLFGGFTGGYWGFNLADTWEWNGSIWILRATTGPPARSGHVMAFDSARDKTVVFGGVDLYSNVLHDTWEWDGSAWAPRNADGPNVFTPAALVYFPSRNACVLHGSSSPTVASQTWEWNGSSWTLVTSGDPRSRSGHSMTADTIRGVVVLYGSGETWEWDGTAWSARALAPPGPSFHGSDIAYDSIRAFTVFLAYASSPEAETWEWDGNLWTLASTVGPWRSNGAIAFDTARAVSVLFGGGYSPVYGDTWEWNGLAWMLAALTGPSPRSDHDMVYDSGRAVMVLFGGGTDEFLPNPVTFGDTWEWNGNIWTLRASDGPSPRRGHAMVYDSARGVTVLFGGYFHYYEAGHHHYEEYRDTWEWDGSTWTLRSSIGPAPRHAHAMAYDAARGVTVLFGGYDEVYSYRYGDTWEWDGSNWKMLTQVGPSPRYRHAMAYDESRQAIVLIAGLNEAGAHVGETWELTSDCNANARPDADDVAVGASPDMNTNGVPDECEDCNTNGILDSQDLLAGFCADCNTDGVPDECHIADADCNVNGVPDECDVAFGYSLDCQLDHVPDECQIADEDCNGNAVPDCCDLATAVSEDCNANWIPDECDIADGASPDADLDGIPDECEQPPGASLNTMLLSTFSNGDEGWTLATTGTLAWTDHGDAGGALTITDAPPAEIVLVAPVKFHGDLSAFDGGFLWFRGPASSRCPGHQWSTTITLSGPGGTASYVVYPEYCFHWNVTLAAEAWGADAATWTAILSDITDLRITWDACLDVGGPLRLDEFAMIPAGQGGWFPPDPLYALVSKAPGGGVTRRTSSDAVAFDPAAQIELLQYRIGHFAPADPTIDIFTGEYDLWWGSWFRLDLLLDGLVNPPGPQEEHDFRPFEYGLRPLYGTILFDVDNNPYTGGDLERAQDYYYANIGRFGACGLWVSDLTAQRWVHTQQPLSSLPQAKRHGGDFELYFGRQAITAIEKRRGDADELFERGEEWAVEGHLFCRAHGYEYFEFWSGFSTDGAYCPLVEVLFSHDAQSDRTSVSFVFPLGNQIEAMDYDDSNEVSILEGLSTLPIAAEYYSGGSSEGDLLLEWRESYSNPLFFLLSNLWSLRMMLATSPTTLPADDQYFIWTDGYPEALPGDLNGDTAVDGADQFLFDDYVATYDGNPYHDNDGNANNGSLTIPDYPKNFSIFDRDYSGVVNACDAPSTPPRRADLNCDGVIDLADYTLFAPCLDGPAHGTARDCHSRDLDHDGAVDLADFALFQKAFQ